MNTGELYPNDDHLKFYEDDKLFCVFDHYPRSLGHTIIVSKEHYEDVSEMPLHFGTHFLTILNSCIKIIKEELNAEKVYVCTMCDGKRNHLHFQLIPRYKEQVIGSTHFINDRKVVANFTGAVQTFKKKMDVEVS
ncbi:HIT family protein [Haloplasma contractile]|uniref:HIT family protein n=1 Tax=Haloplasma contractile SSD-17B TaxID=1033810 RepID=U2E9W4_9MOLU|nr:HIT family protein [Haloplasma contractile]ERJ11918.1 HIT family protein [Haloplasma contractile SSD-17B]